MLVLGRKLGSTEHIIIDGRIKVYAISCQGQTVRIGIEAPREVTIHRSEILAEIQKSNELPAKPIDLKARTTNEGQGE